MKDLLARAWLLRLLVEPERFAFDCDLNMEDDDGNNWTLLARSAWDPTVEYPGAILWVGRPRGAAEVEVMRTELVLTTSRKVMVRVTFRQTALRSLEEALRGD